jgi:hypothetical protein
MKHRTAMKGAAKKFAVSKSAKLNAVELLYRRPALSFRRAPRRLFAFPNHPNARESDVT